MLNRTVAISLLISALFHAVVLVLLQPAWRERQQSRWFRARLPELGRFELPQRYRVSRRESGPSRAQAPAEEGQPTVPDWMANPVRMEPVSPDLSVLGPSAYEVGVRPSEGFAMAPEEDTGPWLGTRQLTSQEPTRQTPDLLRLEDLARSGARRAAVILDPEDPRGVRGYVLLAGLRMDGVDDSCGTVPYLAQFVSQSTRIHAEVRGTPTTYFLSPELLGSAIYFLFPGKSLSGREQPYMSEEETAVLGQYLRGGGFLFIESDPDSVGVVSWAFLKPVIDHIREALAPDGCLIEIPSGHPIYHSYYDFDAGFGRGGVPDTTEDRAPGWYYPRRPRVDGSRGLWGVEVDGQLVAVVSDMGLHLGWAAAGRDLLRPGGNGTTDVPPSELALRAGANILVYALTRPGGLATRHPLPVWSSRQLDRAVPSTRQRDGQSAEGSRSRSLAETRAALGLVYLPLGQTWPTTLDLKIDGGPLTSVQPSSGAVLLTGLVAGEHQLGISCCGTSAVVRVSLTAGRATTVRFSEARYLWVRRLRAKVEDRLTSLGEWRRVFSDMRVVELDVLGLPASDHEPGDPPMEAP